jgi:ABC-type phosphate transport system auxiliary subunit
LIAELAIKQQKTVETLKKLQKENAKIQAELEFIKSENKRHSKYLNDYEVLEKKMRRCISIIEGIIKRIDTVKG